MESLSDQERDRNRELSEAEVLRREYEEVDGDYSGELLGQDNYEQDVELFLSIQDVPVFEEGSADPVITPKLTGQLRFVYSETEYIDAPIQSAEYFSTNRRLNLLVDHPQTGEITMNLTLLDDDSLSGVWVAASAGNSGTTTLYREGN
jgi:hypothetical protein